MIGGAPSEGPPLIPFAPDTRTSRSKKTVKYRTSRLNRAREASRPPFFEPARRTRPGRDVRYSAPAERTANTDISVQVGLDGSDISARLGPYPRTSRSIWSRTSRSIRGQKARSTRTITKSATDISVRLPAFSTDISVRLPAFSTDISVQNLQKQRVAHEVAAPLMMTSIFKTTIFIPVTTKQHQTGKIRIVNPRWPDPSAAPPHGPSCPCVLTSSTSRASA